MKRQVVFSIAISIAISLCFTGLPSAGAIATTNIIRDPSYESPPRAMLHDIVSLDFGGGGAGATFWELEGYRGHQCIRLTAINDDLAMVYSQTLPRRSFSDVTDFGFWYKHIDGVATDLTPMIFMNLTVEGGLYDGYELLVIQWPDWMQGYNYDWTFFTKDSWRYSIWDNQNSLVGSGGWPDGLPLADIQTLFDGTLDGVAIGIGMASGVGLAGAFVDNLIIDCV